MSDAEESVDVLTVPNQSLHANLSLPEIGPDALERPATHVDTRRLLVYQHKLNEKLTVENETLKARCDELEAQLATPSADASTGDATVARHELAAAHAEIMQLRAQLADQSNGSQRRDGTRMHWDMLMDMAEILQGQREQLLRETRELEHASRGNLLNYIERLQNAVTQAHAVLKSIREHATAHPFVSPPPSYLDTRETTDNAPVSQDLGASVSRITTRETPSMLSHSDAQLVSAELLRMQEAVQSLTSEMRASRAAEDAAMRQTEASEGAKERAARNLDDTLHDMELHEARVREEAQRVRHAQRDVADMSRSRGAQSAQLAVAEAALADAQRDLQRARAEHARVAAQRALLDEQLEAATRVGEVYGDAHTQRYNEVAQDAYDARATRDAAEAQLDEQIAQIADLQEEVQQRDHDVARLHEDRGQIIAQLALFERHLRDVRRETEHYGAQLEHLQRQKAMHEREASARRADAKRPSFALALELLRPQLRHLRVSLEQEAAQRYALVCQKAYLSKEVRAQEWLCERLSARVGELAPILRKYGALPPRAGAGGAARRLRSAQWAVVAVGRFQCVRFEGRLTQGMLSHTRNACAGRARTQERLASGSRRCACRCTYNAYRLPVRVLGPLDAHEADSARAREQEATRDVGAPCDGGDGDARVPAVVLCVRDFRHRARVPEPLGVEALQQDEAVALPQEAEALVHEAAAILADLALPGGERVGELDRSVCGTSGDERVEGRRADTQYTRVVEADGVVLHRVVSLERHGTDVRVAKVDDPRARPWRPRHRVARLSTVCNAHGDCADVRDDLRAIEADGEECHRRLSEHVRQHLPAERRHERIVDALDEEWRGVRLASARGSSNVPKRDRPVRAAAGEEAVLRPREAAAECPGHGEHHSVGDCGDAGVWERGWYEDAHGAVRVRSG